MQVKDVLDRVVKDQPDALAVLVRHGEYDYQNLQPPYDVIGSDEVLETVNDVYQMTDSLEDQGYQIGDMILSFDNHSVVSRKIDDGAMVVLTRALGRPQLIKLQVGLGIYTRALEKALAKESGTDTADEAAPHPQPTAEADVKISMPASQNGIGKGLGRMFGRAFGGGTGGTSSGPTKDEIAEAIKAGKKVRHYRGRTYIE